jgi:hypothetical protein
MASRPTLPALGVVQCRIRWSLCTWLILSMSTVKESFVHNIARAPNPGHQIWTGLMTAVVAALYISNSGMITFITSLQCKTTWFLYITVLQVTNFLAPWSLVSLIYTNITIKLHWFEIRFPFFWDLPCFAWQSVFHSNLDYDIFNSIYARIIWEWSVCTIVPCK